MSAFAWPAAPPSDEAEMLSMFSVSEPLPAISRDDCPEHFRESAEAHEHYCAYRLHDASADTRVCHAIFGADEVTGFIAFGITEEQHDSTRHLYVAVRYVHVMQRFKCYGTSMLLQPLLEEVQSVLIRVKAERKLQWVHVHHGYDPVPVGGVNFNDALKLQLRALTKQYRGMTLMN